MKEWLYSEFQKNNIDIGQDVFNYGISVLKEQFICIFISLIISYVLKTVREFFVFLLLFIPIRVNLGGYHCKTEINCYICSVSSCILFPTLIKFVRINYLFEFIFAQIYIYFIFKWGIIDHPNKRLSIKEKQYHLKKLLFLINLDNIILLISIILDFRFMSNCIWWAIFLNFFNSIIVITKRKKCQKKTSYVE